VPDESLPWQSGSPHFVEITSFGREGGAGIDRLAVAGSNSMLRPSTDAERPDRSGDAMGRRLVCVDALRVAIIAMVIVHHAAQAYGPTGGVWRVHQSEQIHWLVVFYSVNAAFGMGLLFAIAGYFVPASYERKGPKRFLAERGRRLGVPLLVFIALHLPLVYFAGGGPRPLRAYAAWLYANGWGPVYLHLWFLGDLLLFTAFYVIWRRMVRGEPTKQPVRAPMGASLVAFTAVIAVATWIVRIRYPVDHWVPLFWIVAAEPAHLPQYVGLFGAGILGYHRDWLRTISKSAGYTWLVVGVVASALAYVVYGSGYWNAFMAPGGLNVSSLARSCWESLVCVSLSIGLVVLFRETVHDARPLLTTLAQDSYAAYILHIYVVVGLQAALLGVALPVGIKLLGVSAVGILLAFGAAHASSRVPGLRAVLGTTRARAQRA